MLNLHTLDRFHFITRIIVSLALSEDERIDAGKCYYSKSMVLPGVSHPTGDHAAFRKQVAGTYVPCCLIHNFGFGATVAQEKEHVNH